MGVSEWAEPPDGRTQWACPKHQRGVATGRSMNGGGSGRGPSSGRGPGSGRGPVGAPGGLRARCGGAAAARRLRGAATAPGTAAEGPGPGPSPPGESRPRSRSRALGGFGLSGCHRGALALRSPPAAPRWHRWGPSCAWLPVTPLPYRRRGARPRRSHYRAALGALCSASPQRRELPELFPNSPAGLPGIAQVPVAPGCLRERVWAAWAPGVAPAR